ncbi:methyltransferase [Methanoculleus taiwanensis]|uniref:Methyltransferase n=1 Tax=Methanoculleus taiwanensis TaxID=1550565 RepID=A0A498H185_9EURY|nr:class I SAM-dependent methyltransferase [Methanoculleus taiwanensis]RXE56114.1 methyltransferase [Methanoculleus taiwanensis]
MTLTTKERKDPSKMAEGIAMHRFKESQKPEGERLCYDPYAIHFITPAILEFAARHPAEANAMVERMERRFPGLSSSILARVRYFDDFVLQSLAEGLEQLVILGAGYDTRAYRIEGLREQVRVFEVDHPETQSVKREKVRELFGSLPEHVVYVPLDLETGDLGRELTGNGYNPDKQTLFILEGLVMYIPPHAVDEILAFIRNTSAPGSAVIFDYYPSSVVDGTCDREIAQNIRTYVAQLGEPLRFGIPEGTAEAFLSERGFCNVVNVTNEDYKKLYFNGKNENREVCSALYFAHGMVE